MSAERLDEEDRERVRERERGEVSVRRFFPSPGAFFLLEDDSREKLCLFFQFISGARPKVASNLSGRKIPVPKPAPKLVSL